MSEDSCFDPEAPVGSDGSVCGYGLTNRQFLIAQILNGLIANPRAFIPSNNQQADLKNVDELIYCAAGIAEKLMQDFN